MQQQWPCNRSINPLPNITACVPACLPVCLFWLLSSATAPHRPFNEPLYLPSADSLPRSLPYSMTHTHTGFQAHTLILLQGYRTEVYKLCMQINTHTRFGCSPVQREMGTGSCERALGLSSTVGKRRHSALHLSRALMLLHTLTPLLLPSLSPFFSLALILCLSIYLSLHFHIYCRNTAEIWGLHHRWSRGLRMAEGERKGIDCENPKPLICHPCPQGPLKRQRRHLK